MKFKFVIFRLINRKKAPIKNSCIVQIEQIRIETTILEKMFPVKWYVQIKKTKIIFNISLKEEGIEVQFMKKSCQII